MQFGQGRYRIGEISERTGLTPDALRYYERLGLLPRFRRSSGGFRIYTSDVVERVRFIKQAQTIGLSLDEIRELVQRLDHDGRIREYFPEENIPEGRPGREPVPTRAVLDAVLWVLNTGAPWHRLPQCYPNDETVHRRFQRWCERDVLREILKGLATTLREAGARDERESLIDATCAAVKGGGAEMGKTKRGKGVKILAIVDRQGLPLGRPPPQ